ncbi:MAG: DUF2855 family protein [Actinomycetota bacterium]|nr:DUF2855 family protein [Actinomycetota bacterium]
MDLEVDRHELHTVRMVDLAPVVLEPGQVRLRVHSFALTSNNITYAVFGDAMNYWDFFPAAPADDTTDGTITWGRIPVWGFADVVESTIGELAEGTRVYGYLPMSTELVVSPGRFDPQGFTDMSPHRAAMASAYNRYVFSDDDPIYDADREPHQMVLWPLFMTSFMIDDLLADQALAESFTGSVVISSASSKTAIGAAFLVARRTGAHVVGLTSPGNAEFVNELGCYHQVVTYDSLHELPTGPAVYVDIAGDSAVTRGVHQHFGDSLAHSMIVGGTHWTAPSTGGDLPGPAPQFFFAPAQIAKRSKDWGRDGLEARTTDAWIAYRYWVDAWLQFHWSHGAAAVEHTYLELLAGNVDPRVGHVCSMEPQ